MIDQRENLPAESEPSTEQRGKVEDLSNSKLKLNAVVSLILGVLLLVLSCILVVYFQINWGVILLFIGLLITALALDMLRFIYPDKF